MNISILGGAGFIGTNLAHYLYQHRHTVSIIDNLSMGNQIQKSGLNLTVDIGDISDPETLYRFLLKNSPDRIYHLAANSDIKNSSSGSGLDLRNTFSTTSSLVSVAHKLQIKELVFASSSAIYGESNVPVKENSPKNPISAYGWMKLASEELLLQCAREGNIQKLLIARFPNVTGHWQTHGVVFDFINQLKVSAESLNVLGDGFQEKPFILASELSKIMENLIELDFGNIGIFNISPATVTTVRRIVDLLFEITNLQPSVRFGDSKAGWIGDVPSYRLDTTLLNHAIPGLEILNSDAAIIEAIKWLWGRKDV